MTNWTQIDSISSINGVGNRIGINSADNKLQSLNVGLDLDQGKGHYRIITQLKRKYPGLKVILSVGGGVDNDPEAETNKYVSFG